MGIFNMKLRVKIIMYVVGPYSLDFGEREKSSLDYFTYDAKSMREDHMAILPKFKPKEFGKYRVSRTEKVY